VADFHQSGPIATLHRLGRSDTARLERELVGFSAGRPITLVLPCHIGEVGTAGLDSIISELSRVPYLKRVIVGIDGAARRRDWEAARAVFSRLPQRAILVWNDGPRMKDLFRTLVESGFDPGPPGKGRNVRICLGCAVADGEPGVVAIHDCDILAYSRELLARLCYPVAHPEWGFGFCKGYYARVSDRLDGRVTRLLLAPLLRALRGRIGRYPGLDYLEHFRYPLAGECALDSDLARRVEIPGDWSLEVGMLAGVARHLPNSAICQSELCENYDHKHRELTPGDIATGLGKMAGDIVRSIFRELGRQGVRAEEGLFDRLPADYARHADECLRIFAADAAINGLDYPRADEKLAVETFVRCIRAAVDAHGISPRDGPVPASWNLVERALPGFLPDLAEAVRRDNE
jgi:glucosyl-3-phosphoglycerate synthase